MKAYRRILVFIHAANQSDALLQRAAELAQVQRAQMLVVRMLDTRSWFEPDGPAAALPEDMAARRAPDVRKRLDLQLARNNLGWVQAQVLWGEPKAVLADVAQKWAPDLIVTCASHFPQGIAKETDILTVGCRGLSRYVGKALTFLTPRYA